MLIWVVPLLIFALLSVFLSLGGIAGIAAQGAKLVVAAAVVLIVISMVISVARRRRLAAP